MTATLSFAGGAGTVTGSCALIEHPGGRFLVDCGLFQGNRTTRELNYGAFPFDAGSIDFLLLTHAHTDHAGLVPKLTKFGFAGPIHATEPTLDLLAYMLPDSGAIQESDVERLNRTRRRRGQKPFEPIYTRVDAEAALDRGTAEPMETWFEPGTGVRARFWNAGHILGSVSIELVVEAGGARPVHILFSGDLGPDEKVFHPEPEAPLGFDYVICESTYGNRDRDDMSVVARRAALAFEIDAALARGGNLVIPCFAVERSQELLHDIGVLIAEGRISDRPVFLDSPLASRITRVFIKHASELDDVALDEAALFRDPNFRIVEDVEDSKAINRIRGGAIIISPSGMADAGRIKHHLRNNLWRDDATVLFVGYQAPGTLGSRILDGASKVRIHGREIEVRATVRSIGNYSAHADQKELLDWILERQPVTGGVFLNHGEDSARTVLRDLLVSEGLEAERIHLPELDQSFDLAPTGANWVEQAPRAQVEELEHDWYDDYVDFSLNLGERLGRAGSPADKASLMSRLIAVLKEGEGDARR